MSAKSKPLTREAFLGGMLKKERVEIPELGGHCYVRQMSAGDKDRWDKWLHDGVVENPQGRDQKSIRAMLVVLTACHEDGSPLFTMEDIAALDGQFFPVLDRIAGKAIEINPIVPAHMEEIAKNLVAGRSGDSSSSSRSRSGARSAGSKRKSRRKN